MAVAASVSLKLPPFWPNDPALWFAQVEAQFATRNITVEKTKFDYVIASLQPEFATEVRDLILSPPADNPYAALKKALVDRTAASEQRRLQQLLTEEELGDRKPSQLLRRMFQLLGDKAAGTEKSFIRELFLQRLPVHVRMVLASTPATVTTEELASLADKIVEVAAPSVSAIPSSQGFAADISDLKSEITQLKQLVVSQSRGRPARSRARTPTPSPPTALSQDLCWYHQKFGQTARKCKQPCSWNSGNAQASR